MPPKKSLSATEKAARKAAGAAKAAARSANKATNAIRSNNGLPKFMGSKGKRKPKYKQRGLSIKQAVSTAMAAGMSGLNLENIGGALGGYYFGAPGMALGRRAGRYIKSVTGLGPYHYSSGTLPDDIPSFAAQAGRVKLEDGEMLMPVIEFVASVIEPASNNGAFYMRTITVNPGNPFMFPWFNGIAAQFEEWTPIGMILCYKTLSSPINNAAGSGIGLGSVMLACDYDAYDSAPTSKQQMLQTWRVMETPPSMSCKLEIETEPKQSTHPLRYVRTGPYSGDLREYDLGTIFIATEGIPASSSNQVIGDLYVTTLIKLSKKIVSASQVPAPITAQDNHEMVFDFTSSGITAALAFGPTVNCTRQPDGSTSGFLAGVTSGAIPGLAIGINAVESGLTVNCVSFRNTTNLYMYVTLLYIIQGASTVLTNLLVPTVAGSNIATPNKWAGTNVFNMPAAATSATQFLEINLKLTPSALSSFSTARISFGTGHTVPTAITGCWLTISHWKSTVS